MIAPNGTAILWRAQAVVAGTGTFKSRVPVAELRLWSGAIGSPVLCLAPPRPGLVIVNPVYKCAANA
jgi:hypothetical protein